MVTCIKSFLIMKLVLVITCLGGQFGINCPSAFLKILWLPKLNEGNFKYSKITRMIYFQNFPNQACDYWLCIKPGIQERGTDCGERGEWVECYIPGNVAKHSGECSQTFRGMLADIPGNVLFTLMVENDRSFSHKGCLLCSIVDCLLCHLLCQKFSEVTCCQTQ